MRSLEGSAILPLLGSPVLRAVNNGGDMRASLVAMAFLVGMSSAAFAQAEPATWQGAMTITKLTGNCTQLDGLRVGQLGTAIFRPRIGSSGASRIQFLWNRAAVNYQKNGGGQMQGNGNYTATK